MLRGSERETALSKLKKATDRYEIQAKGRRKRLQIYSCCVRNAVNNLLHTSKTM
jgi:hypothetical protein